MLSSASTSTGWSKWLRKVLKAIYYASIILKEAEARYTKAEKNGLALIYIYYLYAAQVIF